MNIRVHYCGLANRSVLQDLLEAKLKKLQKLAAIASARVTLVRQHGAKPAFRVLTLLEVPGPDYHAEASDYTLAAAIGKVVRSLEKQILGRRNRRAGNWKTKLRLGLNPGHA